MTSVIETVGKNATFRVTAKDAFGNARENGGDSFFVAVVDAAGVVDAPSVALTDHGDGTYTGAWTPATAASTYEIRVLLGGTHVSGSPMSGVKAVAASSVGAFDAAAAKLDGAGLREATAGAMARFAVYANDANGARVHVGGAALDADAHAQRVYRRVHDRVLQAREDRRRRLGRKSQRRRGRGR